MENATHSFREINVVFQLIWKSQIKSTTVMSWGSRKNRRAFFAPPIRLFCQKKMFLKFVFYFNIYIYNIYISYIYNKYIYIYIIYIYNIYIIYLLYILYILYITWDSLHARLNSHYEASYKKKKHRKITAYRKSV